MGIKIGTFVLSGGGHFNGQAYEMGKINLGCGRLNRRLQYLCILGYQKLMDLEKKVILTSKIKMHNIIWLFFCYPNYIQLIIWL